ncbi:BadF/BadG/BcrA/BcrD ATPase family protein [Actinoallomurus soli]|uniref:BadF/BadG/BcrA/BcrD ATPase family protein n=1 Tax=Actinoallomurus soli TaxID=2952535 RepID=UPI0027E235B9|nr:BadF/BadG/BcrA/BcrD ATPase family protein [Actinoallomurus soli]
MGVDAGGTNTRAAIVTLDGIVAGRGRGPGANPNSSTDPAGALASAVGDALGDLDRLQVVGGVFGIAGAGAAGRSKAVAAATAAWRELGLLGEPEVVTDIAVAFAAGSPAPAGLVVFGGTGAGAAVVDDGEVVRRADGYGWLVGDEGSGVWIGAEAVRAALRAYDGRGRPTTLAESVPRLLLGEAAGPLLADVDLKALTDGAGDTGAAAMSSGAALPQAVLREVYGGPPAGLGRAAPLVTAAAAAGDEVARRIVAEAAEWLLADVDAVRPALEEIIGAGRDGGSGPGIVVAGSLLEKGPIAEAVWAGLRERFGADASVASDGTLGATRLALRRARSRTADE